MADETNGRYDALLMQTVEQIRSDVAEGRRESAEFRIETTGKLAGIDVRMEKIDEDMGDLQRHFGEDAKKNRRLAIRSGALSGALTSALAWLGISLRP